MRQLEEGKSTVRQVIALAIVSSMLLLHSLQDHLVKSHHHWVYACTCLYHFLGPVKDDSPLLPLLTNAHMIAK